MWDESAGLIAFVATTERAARFYADVLDLRRVETTPYACVAWPGSPTPTATPCR